MRGRPLYVGPMIHLRTVPAFEALGHAPLAALAREAEEVLVHRGMPLLEVGRHAEAIHFLVDGSVSFGGADDGAAAGPGDAVGFLEVLSGVPVVRTARAETEAVALRLEADALWDACEAHFPVLDALLTDVAIRLTRDPRALKRALAGPDGALPLGREALDRVGRILALHRSPAFPSTGMDALAELAGQATEWSCDPGTTVWREDEAPQGAFLVCSGRVSLSHGAWPAPVIIGPGGTAGLASTLVQSATGIRAVADTPVLALFVGREPLLDLFEDHSEMAFAFLARLARCVLEGEPATDPPGP